MSVDDEEQPLKVTYSAPYQRYMRGLSEAERKEIETTTQAVFVNIRHLLNTGDADHMFGLDAIKDSFIPRLEKQGLRFDWDARENLEGVTMLHQLACIKDTGALIKWAIEQGANPNIKSETGKTVGQYLADRFWNDEDISHANAIALGKMGASFAGMQASLDTPQEWDGKKKAAPKLRNLIVNTQAIAQRELSLYVEKAKERPFKEAAMEWLKTRAQYDLHKDVMHPSRWQGKEEFALELIGGMPPFLQDDLTLEMRELSERAGALSPKAMRGWTFRIASDQTAKAGR